MDKEQQTINFEIAEVPQYNGKNKTWSFGMTKQQSNSCMIALLVFLSVALPIYNGVKSLLGALPAGLVVLLIIAGLAYILWEFAFNVVVDSENEIVLNAFQRISVLSAKGSYFENSSFGRPKRTGGEYHKLEPDRVIKVHKDI